MVCSLGESLTHHTIQMTSNTRNYNHNVDIKSTQVAGAFKGFAKFALGAGILTVAGLAVIIATFVTSDNQAEKEALARMKNLSANAAILDYKRNPVRYRENWDGEYVTYTGQIGKLNSYEFSFEPISTTRQTTTIVKCDFELSEQEKIARLDNGDYVKVLGKLSLREASNSQFEMKLRDCVLSTAPSSSSYNSKTSNQAASHKRLPSIEYQSLTTRSTVASHGGYGSCDNKTDEIFWSRYPSLRGQKLTSSNGKLAQEWLQIKSSICRI